MHKSALQWNLLVKRQKIATPSIMIYFKKQIVRCVILKVSTSLLILKQNVHNIDQNQTDAQLFKISVTFSDISEMYIFYGKSSVAEGT